MLDPSNRIICTGKNLHGRDCHNVLGDRVGEQLIAIAHRGRRIVVRTEGLEIIQCEDCGTLFRPSGAGDLEQVERLLPYAPAGSGVSTGKPL